MTSLIWLPGLHRTKESSGKYLGIFSSNNSHPWKYLPALKDYADVCLLAQTPDDFILAIANILNGKLPDINRRLKVVQEHTWEKRLSLMET
jgi:hypothetical protein